MNVSFKSLKYIDTLWSIYF